MKSNRRLYILGIIATVIVTVAIFSFILYDSVENGRRFKWVAEITLTIGLLVAARLYVLLKMTSAEAVPIEDFLELKDYTLYLRGFSLDKKFAVTSDTSLIDTAEVLLAKVFKPSLIAIGKPGESLPIPGARRTYIPDEDWKVKVQHLIQHANLIVIRVDNSDGLLWELEQIKNHDLLPKTIFFRSIYEDTDLSWGDYCAILQSTFDVTLPEKAQQSQFMTFSDTGVFYDDRFSFFYDLNERSWRM
ncbi:MAG: hypothetical protein AAFZ63_17550 [Bacteroidota bacterium]